jgi:hypothetical protein
MIVSCINWPKYKTDNPQNIIFDVNVANLAYTEPDTFRAEGIAFIGNNLKNYMVDDSVDMGQANKVEVMRAHFSPAELCYQWSILKFDPS